MKIAKVETMKADAGWRDFSFLKLTTDDGLVGWAEFNEDFGAPDATTTLIGRFAEIVVGMDPRPVGTLGASLRAITRASIGGLNHEAIAAIENACLDIKAKALGVPVCALFGGPFRDRIDLYWSHCGSFRVWRRDFFEGVLGLPPIATLDDVKALGAEVKARGFKSLKTNPLALGPGAPVFNPGFRMMPDFLSRHPDERTIRNIHDVLAAFREGAGPEMELRMDLNFSQRTEGFMRVARAVEDLRLAWLECDIHDPEALALLRRSTDTPIASLETIHGLGAFKPYFDNYSCDVAIVDVQWNGLWESVRVAALADAFETDCAPHNFAGHLASYISAHFCASIPNYRIMEYDVDEAPWRDEIFTHPPVIENGRFVLPDRPGWGTDVNEEAVKAHPPKKRGRR
ncbi:MAG TPA: mandelate racemase/muconate lactonizing enzyme family protein [Hyphomicrobiales bacterium]|nr:mandelate racemase/muconate lactonizing enzyme family protein [Hyphomicrobiales bacterium]